MDKPKQKPIGLLLKEKGLITENHIQYALQEQKITKEKLGELLERLGFVTDHDVVNTLADQYKVEYRNLEELIPDEKILKLFNKNICLKNLFMPISKEENHILVAAYNVNDSRLGQLISRQTGLVPKIFIAEQKKIINAINKFFYFLENPIDKLIETEVRILAQDVEMARGMDNLIKLLFHLAVKMRATDVHIRPMKKAINIAFRIDGVMNSIMAMPPNLNRLTAGIKMRAKMDIAEQRLPQDGRFSATILNNRYDFRVSTVVTPQGENIVIRILPLENVGVGMQQLGFYKDHLQMVSNMFNEPFGIILLTGPTGSGKSTTLYAGIRNLNLLEKNVITVEEPIEYEIPLLRQTQVNEKAGYTFANAIRYFLRHDPDVILVGEIRDSETAATAVTASTTGHLVLSTLHTNSALGAIPRLRDLGVRPYLIADSLVGVVSQRLVRKICNSCKVGYQPSEKEKVYLDDYAVKTLYKGTGCDVCNGSGYFGRTLVYELLTVDREISRLIEHEAEFSQIMDKVWDYGYVSMFDVMVAKIKEGITTVEESVRTLGNIRQ